MDFIDPKCVDLALVPQGMHLADDTDNTFNFDPNMGFSSSQLTSNKLSSLEQLTASTTSTGYTESNYTPTDFQSAVSALNATAPGFSSMYSNDMFEPFLSSIFSSSSATPTHTCSSETETPVLDIMAEESFPFATRPVDVQPFMASIDDDWFYEALANPSMFVTPTPPVPPPVPQQVSTFLSHPSAFNNDSIEQPAVVEMQHYRNRVHHLNSTTKLLITTYIVYLFISAFQTQVPIVHAPTWEVKDKPTVLLGATKACGALFVKTRVAANFVNTKLSTAREDLVHEFVCIWVLGLSSEQWLKR